MAQVRAAIGALYGADVARQKEANEFLVQHASTDAAWSTSLALVADDPSNPPDVQYFGANMMYGKVKGDWGKLPEPHRGPFVQAVSGALTTLLQRPASVLAARRLCMVMAATSVRSGGEATDALVQQALDFAQRGFASGAAEGVTLALEIQAAVADEVSDQRFDVKTALACALVPRIVEVLATSERVLEASVGGNQSSLAGLRSAALHAALAWLRMDSGGGGCVLSPGQLAQSRRGLVVGALEAMAAEDSAVADAAAEFFIAVTQPGAPEASPAEEAAAIAGVVQGLLSHGERILARNDPVATEDLARNVCRVATALCERDANAAAGAVAWDPNAPAASPEFLSLTETVLRLAESHERPVMEAAADYFLMLNTVPTSQRHPSAGEPLFRRLAAACLRRAELPADFTSWEEADEDRDTFVRFREQILADLLDNCQAQMRSGYLAEVGAALGAASSWQRAEACVFAARVVASPLRRDILEPSLAGASGPDAEAERSSAMLEQLLGTVGEAGRAASAAGDAGFAAIAGSNVFGSHPVVVESTARMIGAYAPWLGGTVRGHARQETVLMYLLCALRVPAAFRHASHAFRSVCARCAKRLNNANTVTSLLDSVQKTLPAAPPKTTESSDGKKNDDDDRSAVIEAIARVIASMPDPIAAADFAKRLAAPVAARAREHMNAANLAQARLDLLGAEVRLIAAAVRFLEFANLVDVRGAIVEHPAIATLSAAWPTLSALNAEPWRSAPEVVDALCEVYTRSLLCAKTAVAPLLPHLLEFMRDAFVAHRHPSCLDALAVAVEVFSAPDPTQPGASRVPDPNTANSFANVLLACAQAAHASLSQSPIAEQADVARATFELANKYALFAPDVLLSSPALQPLMGAACAAIGTNEREAVRAALGMISALIEPGRRAGSTATWQNGRGVVDAWATSSGGGDALVRALLSAGGNDCPRHLLRPVAQLLHAVRGRYGRSADAWLTSAVLSPSFPSPNDPCDDDAKRAFCELATRELDPLPPQRWSAMAVDFFQICRREADKDALLAHQM